jgi:hypothetical protein
VLSRVHPHVSVPPIPIDGAGHLIANRQSVILWEAVVYGIASSHV